ncbi:MAG: hypothetical protein HC822_24295 [Oscillochloris sp.]|nr:hypothetical protein [Oscillochloris sp.]
MSTEVVATYDHRAPRPIATRLIVTGTLHLLTPAHLGNGDAEAITDMPLLLDTVGDDPVPLLTGTSIAGALRGYLLTRGQGYRAVEQRRSGQMAELLFGAVKGDDTGEQSPLIVDDALGVLRDTAALEVRDGVKINYATRTADDRFKYDLELLPAGTTFSLRFELLLPPIPTQARALRHALAVALSGLSAEPGREHGDIFLGARRSRGFGRCVVSEWSYAEYELRDNIEGLLAWITAEHSGWAPGPTRIWQGGPQAALGAGETGSSATDARRRFVIDGRFALTSILVRSSDPLLPADELPDDTRRQLPDVTHIRSFRDENGMTAILPGTSLAGALRSRAAMILATLAPNAEPRRQALLNSIFGFDMHRAAGGEAAPTASRLIVEERPIDLGQLLVQSRVAIDRFTGGAFETALFSEAPWFGGAVQLHLTLHHDAIPSDPATAEAQAAEEHARIGLLLLLLKDLWSGDLPLGGSASVGRGIVRGIEADLKADADTQWHLRESDSGLLIEEQPAEALERYLQALHTYLGLV